MPRSEVRPRIRSGISATIECGSAPEIIGAPHYEADHKTCVIKVKLEPGKAYGWWLNSQKYNGFKDARGRAAIPYLLVFRTRQE